MRELIKRGEQDPWNMHHTSFDHPPVDVLERFALSKCSEDEVEVIESHILACESCVYALENLEVELAAFKLALEETAQAQRVTEQQSHTSSWKKWFSVPTLSWAGAALAACAFCLVAFVPTNTELAAQRGADHAPVVPEWRSANLSLDDQALPAGQLRAEVVDQNGSVVWAGTANSVQGHATVNGLRITHAGRYYARLYTSGAEHELIDEFPFEAQMRF